MNSTLWPSRKWWVGTATAVGTLAVMLLTGDRAHVTDPEVVAIIGTVVQRIAAWAVPNADVDAGRQLASKRTRRKDA